jgi:DNA-binding NtrC family response regulator
MIRVLLVDDEEVMAIAETLKGNDDFEVTTAIGMRAAMREMRRRPFDVVVLDLVAVHAEIEGEGIEPTLKTLDEIREKYPNTEVIVLKSVGTEAEAVTAMEKGAFSYVDKSVQGWNVLPIKLRLAYRHGLGRRHILYCEEVATQLEAEVERHLGTVVKLIDALKGADLMTPDETRAYVDPIMDETDRSMAAMRELIRVTSQWAKSMTPQ